MCQQRSLHSAPICCLVLKVAMNGKHQCDCRIYWEPVSSSTKHWRAIALCFYCFINQRDSWTRLVVRWVAVHPDQCLQNFSDQTVSDKHIAQQQIHRIRPVKVFHMPPIREGPSFLRCFHSVHRSIQARSEHVINSLRILEKSVRPESPTKTSLSNTVLLMVIVINLSGGGAAGVGGPVILP